MGDASADALREIDGATGAGQTAPAGTTRRRFLYQLALAGVGAALFLWVVAWLYERVRHMEGMGFGDVKMALCMGIYLGAAVVPALFVGFVAGAVVGVGLMVGKGKDAKSAVPFGPFLAAGAVVCLFVCGWLIDAYLGLALPDR